MIYSSTRRCCTRAVLLLYSTIKYLKKPQPHLSHSRTHTYLTRLVQYEYLYSVHTYIIHTLTLSVYLCMYYSSAIVHNKFSSPIYNILKFLNKYTLTLVLYSVLSCATQRALVYYACIIYSHTASHRTVL